MLKYFLLSERKKRGRDTTLNWSLQDQNCLPELVPLYPSLALTLSLAPSPSPSLAHLGDHFLTT